jgi:hypothetical protein
MIRKAKLVLAVLTIFTVLICVVSDNLCPLVFPLKPDLRAARIIPVKLDRCTLYVRQGEARIVKILDHLFAVAMLFGLAGAIFHCIDEGWFRDNRTSK